MKVMIEMIKRYYLYWFEDGWNLFELFFEVLDKSSTYCVFA